LKKVYIVHTSAVSQAELMSLFAEIIPEAKVFNIVDDSLLHDVMANGAINEQIISRMCKYFEAAAAVANIFIIPAAASPFMSP